MVQPAEIKHLRLFSGIDRSEIEKLLLDHRVRRFEPGEFVFKPGDSARHLFLLLKGIVKTYVYSSQGQQQIIHVFYPGDAFGDLVFGCEQEPWAEAMDDVVVVAMDESEFKTLMQSNPDVCLNILDDMVKHHEIHVRRIRTLIHTRASHRLAMTLLHLGELQGDQDNDEFTLEGNFTHQDLANMIGVVRSTVSELIGELRRCGVVGGTRRQLRIDRRAAQKYLSDE